jgi:hypothetical protein
MSTSVLLSSIQRNLFRFGGPILLFVGSVSSTLNMMVFTKKKLRKNPCSICFMGVNIINFLYFYLLLLLVTLSYGYNIDPSASNIVICRFRFYMGWVLACLQSSYIILASIDRTLITSRNAETRNLSSRRLITTSMIGLALFWMVIHIHALIFTELVQYGPNYFVCYFQPGTYNTVIPYVSLVTTGCLPLLLMIVFAFWTVKNVRQVRRPIHPPGPINTAVTVVGRQHTLQSKDQQLIRMLLVDIISFVICKCSFTVMQIYLQITQYNEKSAEQQTIEQIISQLTYFIYYIDSCISCYTNMFVSKTFRKELKDILLTIHRRCLHQRN